MSCPLSIAASSLAIRAAPDQSAVVEGGSAVAAFKSAC
jgi:hypothetical protein